MLNIFSCPYWSSVYLLWISAYSGPLTIFKLGCLFFFFAVELYMFFIYFENLPLIGCTICKYLLPFNRLPFHFNDGFFLCAKGFSFYRSHLFIFASLSLPLSQSHKNTAKTDFNVVTAYAFF